ncbi:DUF413 domain-containing protein [Catenovulum sp. SM1970]|uniref:DUF413 domain-containing protein n=1 Tax=Marinifaba aquimaris TaxID=2741323 RepID=UPI001574689A|nr:DUF413 domain-containing protein [Marinifaba aquimaris]NTS76937.1 DUF413 domain-containing protein [Marinifaba aquimaris]
MAAPTKNSLLARLFSDFKNYPQGFHRSGDFSIKEADALEKYGNLLDALEKGQIQPSDDDDLHFVSVLRSECEPSHIAAKAWLKYIKRINRPKMGSIYGSKKIVSDEVDDSADDMDNSDLADVSVNPEVEE